MGHSIGDGVIVLALGAALVGYFYVKSRERQRRLEIVHAERLIAMDKGIPLPELPLEPPLASRQPNAHVPLILGIVLAAFGFGSMIALKLATRGSVAPTVWSHAWPMPLPIALMGVGLMLYFALARERRT